MLSRPKCPEFFEPKCGQRLTSGPYILVIQMAFLQPCSAYESISEIKIAGFALVFLHKRFKVVMPRCCQC